MPDSAKKRVRTTVRLPQPLYEQAKSFVDQEIVTAANIDDFFVNAIGAYVGMLRRKQIDEDFARMDHDERYKSVSRPLEREFAAILTATSVAVVVPLTDRADKQHIYHSQVEIRRGQGGLKSDSAAMCEQVRAVSKERLRGFLGQLDASLIAQVDAALRIALDS